MALVYYVTGAATVNQSVSLSFDSSKLVCISCDKKHNLISSKPLVVLFTDQNFVPSLPSESGSCVNIGRVENASLNWPVEYLEM